jgi:hypothetical protein
MIAAEYGNVTVKTQPLPGRETKFAVPPYASARFLIFLIPIPFND